MRWVVVSVEPRVRRAENAPWGEYPNQRSGDATKPAIDEGGP